MNYLNLHNITAPFFSANIKKSEKKGWKLHTQVNSKQRFCVTIFVISNFCYYDRTEILLLNFQIVYPLIGLVLVSCPIWETVACPIIAEFGPVSKSKVSESMSFRYVANWQGPDLTGYLAVVLHPALFPFFTSWGLKNIV